MNNLDFLRLGAALLVIIGHQYVLFGFDPPALLDAGIDTWGLRIFFVISGWLISQSWDRDRHLIRFTLRRGLRIIPALVVLILLTVFIFGPVLTKNSLASYLDNPRTYEYLKNCALYIVYYLPGVFETNPLKYAVNGSLWSLPSEVAMYCTVALIGSFLSARVDGPFLWAGVLIVGVAVSDHLSSRVGAPIVIYATSVTATLEVGVFFIAGVLLWKCRSFHRPRTTIGIVAIAALWFSGDLRPFVESILFAYAIMAFGLASTPILNAAARYGDFSYGAYLYAFPIQQTSYQIFGVQGFRYSLPCSIAVAFGCAFVSWRLVERHALRMKPRKPPEDASQAAAGKFVRDKGSS